nr:NADH dehydrogenase subunit 2 [Selenocephalus sp.]
MKFNSTKLLLVNVMVIGVTMTICSNNWISMWLGLEISLLSFIPLMQNNKLISSESMIKYFIMQSIASTVFLISVVILLIGVNMNNEMMMTIAMLMKIGLAPFHNWILLVIESLEYYTVFMMLTIMKLPPMTILYYQSNMNLLNIPILLSMVLSAVMCLNQSSIKKILGFSSIFNMSLVLILINEYNFMLMFLFIYSITLMLFIQFINPLKINYINQMKVNEFNSMVKFNLWFNTLSMGGFPPLIGFMGKLMVIQVLIQNNLILLLTIMILTSMLVMVFYMRMVFSMLLTNFTSQKWSMMKSNTNYFNMSLNLLVSPIFMTMFPLT